MWSWRVMHWMVVFNQSSFCWITFLHFIFHRRERMLYLGVLVLLKWLQACIFNTAVASPTTECPFSKNFCWELSCNLSYNMPLYMFVEMWVMFEWKILTSLQRSVLWKNRLVVITTTDSRLSYFKGASTPHGSSFKRNWLYPPPM